MEALENNLAIILSSTLSVKVFSPHCSYRRQHDPMYSMTDPYGAPIYSGPDRLDYTFTFILEPKIDYGASFELNNHSLMNVFNYVVQGAGQMYTMNLEKMSMTPNSFSVIVHFAIYNLELFKKTINDLGWELYNKQFTESMEKTLTD